MLQVKRRFGGKQKIRSMTLPQQFLEGLSKGQVARRHGGRVFDGRALQKSNG